MYTMHFDEEVIDFLKKLPKEDSKRIYDKIISTKDNPTRFFERLEGRTEYKLRVGDFRVIADIDQATQLINVILVGHRKNVYKNI